MKKKLLHFKGVYGENQVPFWDMDVYIEPIKLRSESYNYEIDEHLHSNLIQIFLLQEGGGICYSEGTAHVLKTPCVIVVPNDNLHGFDWNPDIKGHVLTFTTSFFENSLVNSQHILIQFQKMKYLELDEHKLDDLNQFLDQMSEELKMNELEKSSVIRSLLELFMTKIYRYDLGSEMQTMQRNNRALNYLNKFQKLIAKKMDKSITINKYAKTLEITPVHLNRICQNTVGKSALQIVNEKFINHSKKHLLGTTNTISEVSYHLNFRDPSHFSKFFKKMTGHGPRDFRKMAAEKKVQKNPM